MEDYYEILEVHPKASQEVIVRAYRVLVARYHPDKQPPEKREWATKMMKRINEAFEVLSDPQKRAQYDEARKHAQHMEAQKSPKESRLETTAYSATATSPQTQHVPCVYVHDYTVCAFHPNRPRVSICLRCHCSICEQCRVMQDGRPYCFKCAKEIATQDSTKKHDAARLAYPTTGSFKVVQTRPLVFGWTILFLATIGLAVWLYAFIAPQIVKEERMKWIIAVVCLIVAAVFVYAITPTIEKLLLPRIQAILPLILIPVVCIGVWRVLSVWDKIQDNIVKHSREVAKRAKEDEAKRYLENFVSSFPGHEIQRTSKVQQLMGKFASYEETEQDEEDDQVNAESVYPFPDSLLQDQKKFASALENATKFIEMDYSKSPAQMRNRAVCLHFIVWAELKRPTGKDVTKEAQECLDIARRLEQKSDCRYYLARCAYHCEDLDCLRRIRKDFADDSPGDARISDIDKWILEIEQEKVKAKVNELLPRIMQKDRQAVQEGLSLLVQETIRQLPGEADRLAWAILDSFREDLQVLCELLKNYRLANPSGQLTQDIQKAIDSLQKPQQQRASQQTPTNNP